MTDQTKIQFPLTLVFDQGDFRKEFASHNDLMDWVIKEGDFWTKYNYSHEYNREGLALSNNVLCLKRIREFIQNESQEGLNRIAVDYTSSEGNAGCFISKIQDGQIARLVYSEIIQNSGPKELHKYDNLTNIRPAVEALVYATIYRAIGNVATSYDSTKVIHDLRERGDTQIKLLQGFREQCSKEWKEKIEDFQLKIATAAPADHWKGRASKHNESAKNTRKEWGRHYAAVASTFIAYPIISIFMAIELSIGVEKIVIAATAFLSLLSLAVWWLRQKLRDLRSHEHLATDAEERVTMIQTYMALKEAGLQSDDLSPILTALYRPCSTGLIEDGAPAIPLEVILKQVADKAGK